ncbi:M23 family metallopeptidase [Flavobacteriaceae bacterium]|nr:M23 family metallopeptidase [Flavobacteriaceae bacterium]MDC1491793.1 M23 family metallopeptidase [Flavobacteriaceae bacterium]
MTKSILKILFFLISLHNVNAQNNQRTPLDYEPILSGTFGELRSNHFHSGLDIKTKGQEGSKVYAFAEGYISRIKISKGGYGKAIYIKHKDGKTTVYAHLQMFSEKIQAVVKNKQYKSESYEIEIFPAKNEIKISTNEHIAFSGNTGGSSGPHLHFEIRDVNQKPLNPLNYGINVKDNTIPSLLGLKVYSLYKNGEIKSSNNLSFYKNSTNSFIADTTYSLGDIGIGIQTFDRLDLANNKNGVYKINTFIDNDTLMSIDFSKFSFDETKHINRYIDYAEFKKTKKRFQKLFIQKNNPLSIYKKNINKGIVSLASNDSYLIKIEVLDFNRNVTKIFIPLKGSVSEKTLSSDDKIKLGGLKKIFVNSNNAYQISQNNSSLSFEKGTFYNNFFIQKNSNNDTLNLGYDTIPLIKSMKIKFKKPDYKNSYIGILNEKTAKPSFVSSKLKEDSLVAYTKRLGTYIVSRDTINPTITPLGFNKDDWISNLNYLKIQIKDTHTGIKNYRATINDKWILMEPFNKNGVIMYDFNDNVITESKNIFKIEVLDNVGNTSVYETIFYRKTN